LLARGLINRENWNNTSREFDFYDLKGLLIALFNYLGYKNVSVSPVSHPGFAKNKCGLLEVNNKKIGPLGEITGENLDPSKITCGAEVNLSKLSSPPEISYTPYSDKPTVKRDLDLILEIDQPVGPVKETIREVSRWLEKITIFDLYRGKPLAKDEKSVSFNLEFRCPDKTLSDSEVNEIQEKILHILQKKYGARLREG